MFKSGGILVFEQKSEPFWTMFIYL